MVAVYYICSFTRMWAVAAVSVAGVAAVLVQCINMRYRDAADVRSEVWRELVTVCRPRWRAWKSTISLATLSKRLKNTPYARTIVKSTSSGVLRFLLPGGLVQKRKY